jgi:hypothetical protein
MNSGEQENLNGLEIEKRPIEKSKNSAIEKIVHRKS